MKVYIQKVLKEYPDDWVFAAMLGFKEKGFEIKYFEEQDVELIPSNNVIVVGFVSDTIKYFELNNITVPKPLNIPQEVFKEEFLKREVKTITFGELKAKDIMPIFIKPHDQTKLFPGGVVSKHSSLPYLKFDNVSDDTFIQTSSLIDIVSEYRCFVHKNKIVGIKHYLGDFTVFPDVTVIEKIKNTYISSPVAYTVDVGITSDGDTLLIECQDMWSIGNYGLDSDIYASMLRDRWLEIIKK